MAQPSHIVGIFFSVLPYSLHIQGFCFKTCDCSQRHQLRNMHPYSGKYFRHMHNFMRVLKSHLLKDSLKLSMCWSAFLNQGQSELGSWSNKCQFIESFFGGTIEAWDWFPGYLCGSCGSAILLICFALLDSFLLTWVKWWATSLGSHSEENVH